MIISKAEIKALKEVPNSGYNDIKLEFLYHSNKMEGSTFSTDNLIKAINDRIIEGNHDYDDVIETMNSIELFDFIIDTIDEPLSKRLIREYHALLKRNTLDHERGFAGCWKKIPNRLLGTDLLLAQPSEVEERIEMLLNTFENSEKQLIDVLQFHAKFELTHPFQDGNGRIGRFIMLRQCIENEIDLIAIDDQYSSEYKSALYQAQKTNDYKELEIVINKCIERLDEKLSFINPTLDVLEL